MPRWSPGGLYLALETSGPLGSVALARGADVLARAFLPRAGEQSSRVLPAVQRVLVEAGVPTRSLAGVVVGAGPGSFTGVRIAAATAKGLVHALGIPLWAFSSLAAGALSDLVIPRDVGPDGWWGGEPSGTSAPLRYVLFDARGERLYAAGFRVPDEGAVERVIAGHPTTVAEILASLTGEDVALMGDGALRHRDRLEGAGLRVWGAPAGTPSADGLLHLLARSPLEPPVASPARWEPEYLKSSSAEAGRSTGTPSPQL